MSNVSDPILITGVAGLVGQALRPALAHHPLIGTSRSAGEVRADLLHPADLRELERPFSSVVHCASVLPDFDGDPRVPNVEMTLNLLNALENNPPIRFIHISSASVYAIPSEEEEVRLAEDRPLDNTSPYGISKIQQESLIVDWCSAHSVPYTILRLSGVYGRGQRAFGALPIFWEKAKAGEMIEVHAPRSYVQNYISSADVAAIVATLIDQEIEGVFNLFSDETLSMLALARRICAFVGRGEVLDKTTDQAYPRVQFDRGQLDSLVEHRFRTLEEGLECLS